MKNIRETVAFHIHNLEGPHHFLLLKSIWIGEALPTGLMFQSLFSHQMFLFFHAINIASPLDIGDRKCSSERTIPVPPSICLGQGPVWSLMTPVAACWSYGKSSSHSSTAVGGDDQEFHLELTSSGWVTPSGYIPSAHSLGTSACTRKVSLGCPF